MISKEEYERGVEATMQEINGLHLSGAIQAMGCVLVLENGRVRTFLQREQGAAFTLIAGCTLLEHQAVLQLREQND